ncbi:hypothetical protein HMPREF3212_00849 [Citrobacter freundii]|nr:hypothetical protein HMPREF3212_00849 [Citrobacter freundii]
MLHGGRIPALAFRQLPVNMPRRDKSTMTLSFHNDALPRRVERHKKLHYL